jgi:hypothetical protein
MRVALWFSQAESDGLGLDVNINGERKVWLLTMEFPVLVKIIWSNPNEAAEGVTGYNVYVDGVLAGSAAAPQTEKTVVVATPGLHTFGVSALNGFAEGTRAELAVQVVEPTAPTVVSVTKAA